MKRTVLMAASDSLSRESIRAASGEGGDFSLSEAGSLDEAILAMRNADDHFDVVIVDTEISGGWRGILEVAGRMSELTDVVVLGPDDGKTAEEAVELGAVRYESVPVSADDLKRVMGDVIAHQENRDEELERFRVEDMREDWLELTAASEPECIERFRNFTDLLSHSDIDAKTRRDLTVAINELGQNAIEWGNRWNREKKVRLSYAVFEDRVMLKIADEGEGFNFRNLENPTLAPLDYHKKRLATGKRPGGYGIYLVRKLMDKVLYNEKGNIVVMTKYTKKPDRKKDARGRP